MERWEYLIADGYRSVTIIGSISNISVAQPVVYVLCLSALFIMSSPRFFLMLNRLFFHIEIKWNIHPKSIKSQSKIHQKWIKHLSKIVKKSRSGGLRCRFGGVLGRLGRSKASLEASWTVLEASWRRLGGVLEASWAVFGLERWPTWLQLGPQNGAKIN